MKTFNLAILALASCLALNCQTSQADGGRLWIYPYDWGTYWEERPEYQNVPNPTDSEVDYSKVEPPLPTVGENESPESEAERALTERMQREELRQAWRETLRNLIASHRKVALPPGALPTPEDPDPKKIITLREQEKVLGGNNAFIDGPTGGGSEPGYVNVPEQQAIIAWNGHEDENGKETIILTTEEFVYGSCGLVLNIVPLPGQPISITLADNGSTFRESKELLFSKTPQPPQRFDTITPIIIGEKKKCPHNIFVWELDNVETFQRDVQAWIAKRFDNKAAALFTEDSVRVLQFYIERGFRYFAFDLTEVSDEVSSKVAIAYTFISKAVYYPLVISQIGGTNDYSTVDLIIITPGSLKAGENSAIKKFMPPNRPAANHDEATLVRGGTVKFTIDEVRGIDKHLDVFDNGTEMLTVRNIKFRKRLNSFNKDFILK